MMPKQTEVFLTIDDKPLVLKRPLLPFAHNSYRIPLFINYNPQIENWPEGPYYFTGDFEIKSILINGSRFPYHQTDHSLQENPPQNRYTIHEMEGIGKLICIAFDINTLWQYMRIEVVATDKASYSLYGSRDPDGDANPPMIASLPDIKRNADALKYARFSFDSLSLDLIWNCQRINLYGGEAVLSLRHNDKNGEIDMPMGRYVIGRISYNKEKAKIQGADYRSLFNTKYPIDTFTKNEYPFIEDEYIDQVKPEMIGIGNGVPGICLQGNQIYKDPIPDELGKLTHYQYRFPPGWKELYKIEIKTNDTWLEVYPGYGNPYFKPLIPDDPQFPEYNPESPVLNAKDIDPAAGIVTVPALLALGIGDAGNINYGNAPSKFRMYAKWPNSAMHPVFEYDEGSQIETIKEPGALKFLMDISGDNTLSSGLSGEWEGLAEIGLYLNESKPIFEWIEKLQSGNIIGGQLMIVNDLFKFKIENPNRKRKLTIPMADVLNHADLEVASADELWFSGWSISYVKSLADDITGKIIGNSGFYPSAELFNGEDLTAKLVYPKNSPAQQFFDTSKAQQKINIIRDTITAPRHKIESVTVAFSKEYLGLEIYDVVSYMPEALYDLGQEEFEWIVYDKKINIKQGTIALRLIERKKTAFWDHDPFIVFFDKNNSDIESTDPEPLTKIVKYPAANMTELPISPARVGYKFAGWNTDKLGHGCFADENTTITGDMELFAIWEKDN